MGGVDQCDQNIACYRISFRSKKWWWALFAWVPDMVMENAWNLHRKLKSDDDPYHDLLSFHREFVNTYLAKYKQIRSQSGRPRGCILPAKRRANSDLRFDRIDHFQSQLATQKRCGQCGKTHVKGVRNVVLVFMIIVSRLAWYLLSYKQDNTRKMATIEFCYYALMHPLVPTAPYMGRKCSVTISHLICGLKVLNHASRILPRFPYTNLKKSHTEKNWLLNMRSRDSLQGK